MAEETGMWQQAGHHTHEYAQKCVVFPVSCGGGYNKNKIFQLVIAQTSHVLKRGLLDYNPDW